MAKRSEKREDSPFRIRVKFLNSLPLEQLILALEEQKAARPRLLEIQSLLDDGTHPALANVDPDQQEAFTEYNSRKLLKNTTSINELQGLIDRTDRPALAPTKSQKQANVKFGENFHAYFYDWKPACELFSASKTDSSFLDSLCDSFSRMTLEN